MKRTTFYAAAALLGTVAGTGLIQAFAKPVSYKLPEETATLRPGPNRDVAEANCTGCHSADYLSTQPRGEKFKEDFWKAEVAKMIKVYGAPIADADVPKIVEYLTKAYADGSQAAAPGATGKPAAAAAR